MSITNHPADPSATSSSISDFDCQYDNCDADEPAGTHPHGAYCSQACADRDRGQGLINTLVTNHRFCGTCFARLKHVDSPTEDWRRKKQEPVEIAAEQGGRMIHEDDGSLRFDATPADLEMLCDPDSVTGFQHLTENASLGLLHKETPEGMPDGTRVGVICGVCGNASLNEEHAFLRTQNVTAVVEQFTAAAQVSFEKGDAEHALDEARFKLELRDHYKETGELDVALAAGRALHAASGDGGA